jgi:hypothetical protein
MSRKRRDKTIRIKYYGLIPVTRRGYVRSSMITLTVLGFGLLLGWAAGFLPPLSTMWGERWPQGELTPWPWLYQYFYWLVLAGLIAEVIVTLRMLRRFTELEAEQKARQAQHADHAEEAKT